MHRLAEKVIAGGLIDLGIVRGSIEHAVQSRAMSVFFPHGLGHFMGLDVHDVGGYPKVFLTLLFVLLQFLFPPFFLSISLIHISMNTFTKSFLILLLSSHNSYLVSLRPVM